MKKLSNLISDKIAKQIILALIVLAIGIPVNYYVLALMQNKSAEANTEELPDAGELALLREDANSDTHQQQDVVEDLKKVDVKETAVEHAVKHSDPTYICPMHPDITSKDPEATCLICGMDLVVFENIGEADVVQLSSTVINSLGVRTEKVKRRNLYRRINSVGYISVDEKNIRRVSLRTEGWVEKLAVKSEGERVKQGDLLFQVYSPTLVNAQEEYVQALELDSGDGLLLSASNSRLRALGISLEQINQLRESKTVEQLISIYAPQDGVITDLNIREGDFVPPSQPIVSIIDLSGVWLLADIFESQIDWVKVGQSAEMKLAFLPEKTWEGIVEYVYPSLDLKTRSVRARLRFDNSDELLKPNMYANVAIFAEPKRKVLAIPREAVIRTGEQSRVIISQGEGKFKPAIIHTGIETDNSVEVLGGLEEGQEVVTSSQFLIDSESSMKAALARMAGQ